MRFERAVTVVGVALVFVVTAASSVSLVRSRRVAAERQRRADTAVAIVNGTAIGADDLEVRLEELLPMASYHGRVEPNRLLALKRAALDDLVLDELIYREAVAAGRRPAALAVDQELAAVKGRFDDASQFARALRENGMTESAFRDRVTRTVLVREAREAHARQTVTDGDIAQYYRANGEMFERPETVHLIEILVRTDPSQPSSFAIAERRARQVLARLRRGEEFGAVARSLSEDEYRVKDGDMGFVHRGRLDPEFEQAVFAARVGELGLARSLYGFEVYTVLERQPPTRLSEAEARPIIAERLERLRCEQALRAWHARLLAAARVDIRDAALRRARPADVPLLALTPGSRSAAARPRPGSSTPPAPGSGDLTPVASSGPATAARSHQ